ncbi:unnamed protein product [Pylaiella littoralis]
MSEDPGQEKGSAAGAAAEPSPFQDYGRKRSEVHISWDEPTIAEHDKLRGTRQKIDEPSTPYHYGSGESSTGSDCESADGKGPSLSASSSTTGSPHQRRSRSGSTSSVGDRRGSILKVMADVSAALPSESALRRERQARWDSDVSEGSSHGDKEKARKFKQHREAHYNEFKALQEWRDKNRSGDAMMDDDSDSDDGDDNGDTAEVSPPSRLLRSGDVVDQLVPPPLRAARPRPKEAATMTAVVLLLLLVVVVVVMMMVLPWRLTTRTTRWKTMATLLLPMLPLDDVHVVMY